MTSLAGIRNEPYTATPGVVFSSGQLWKNFRIDLFHYPPAHLRSHATDEHTLIFNLGEPLPFAWKTEGQWKKGLCNTGNVAGFLSPYAEEEEMLWEQDHAALVLSFKTAFADELTGTGNFSFKIPHNVDDTLLKHIAGILYEEISAGHIAGRMYAESLMITCIVHLASMYGACGRKIFAPKGKLSSGQLKQVIDYTRARIHSTLSLTQLASCVHLSAFHFSRLFRQTVGISPYRFVLRMKIELAQKLIKENYGSLSDVAYSLNFTDQAHFSNAFKKITGVCPRLFLRRPQSTVDGPQQESVVSIC
jgi:AraC family transcriptional regulator